MKKKALILWGIVCIFLSACVFLSFPACKDKKVRQEKTEEKNIDDLTAEEQMWSELVDNFFANREIRDVPQNADFSSFLIGTFAKEEKDFSKIASSFSKVLESDPENKEIKQMLFFYYVLAQNLKSAQLYAYQALDLQPDDAMALLTIFTEQIRQEKYEEALLTLNKIKGSYQNFPNPILKAWVYAAMKDKKRALSCLDKIKEDKNLAAIYYLNAGLILDYLKEYKSAAQMYDSLTAASLASNVRILLILKEFEDRTHLLRNKDLFSMMYLIVSSESFMAKEMMNKPDLKYFKNTPQHNISWVFFDLATLGVSEEESVLGLFFTNLSLFLSPNSPLVVLFQGELLENLELYNSANDLYDQSSYKGSVFLSAQMRKVINLIKVKKYTQAISVLQNLIEKYPNTAVFYMSMADALREKKDYLHALEYYKKTESLIGEKHVSLPSVWFYQGVCLEALGKLEEATLLFERALKKDSKNPLYLNYLGYTWLKQKKNTEQAFNLIEQAHALVPEDGNILDSLGWAYYQMGNYEKSLSILEKAVALQAGNAVINSHLGDVYWKLGRLREARFQWSHAQMLPLENSAALKKSLDIKIKKGLPETEK